MLEVSVIATLFFSSIAFGIILIVLFIAIKLAKSREVVGDIYYALIALVWIVTALFGISSGVLFSLLFNPTL